MLSNLNLEFFHFGSFTAVWYWVFLALSWSRVAHYVMGVPFDAVQRAERVGGAFVEDVDRMAEANARRFVSLMRYAGVWLIGVGTFFLTGIVVLALVFDNQAAQAVAVIALPQAVVGWYTWRLSERVLDAPLTGEALWRALARRRFWNQVAGFVSLCAAAAFTGRLYGMAIVEGQYWLR
ncbi:MAG: component of SufBCD complex [Pseudomonadota bacterium]